MENSKVAVLLINDKPTGVVWSENRDSAIDELVKRGIKKTDISSVEFEINKLVPPNKIRIVAEAEVVEEFSTEEENNQAKGS